MNFTRFIGVFIFFNFSTKEKDFPFLKRLRKGLSAFFLQELYELTGIYTSLVPEFLPFGQLGYNSGKLYGHFKKEFNFNII